MLTNQKLVILSRVLVFIALEGVVSMLIMFTPPLVVIFLGIYLNFKYAAFIALVLSIALFPFSIAIGGKFCDWFIKKFPQYNPPVLE